MPDPVTSGSVRAQMMVGQSGTYAGGERATHRLRDRSNVAIARPWLEFFHGRILSSGVVDTELETGLASGVAAKYRAAILTGISGTGKNQTGATVHRATFLGMLDDAAFVAAGGAVSADGLTVTVPNGWRFRSDRLELSLSAGRSISSRPSASPRTARWRRTRAGGPASRRSATSPSTRRRRAPPTPSSGRTGARCGTPR